MLQEIIPIFDSRGLLPIAHAEGRGGTFVHAGSGLFPWLAAICGAVVRTSSSSGSAQRWGLGRAHNSGDLAAYDSKGSSRRGKSTTTRGLEAHAPSTHAAPPWAARRRGAEEGGGGRWSWAAAFPLCRTMGQDGDGFRDSIMDISTGGSHL